MTELQKAELDILRHVLDICDALRLRCYLVCGSALGAVKYGGFIPWDDDVDVALLREDYEAFVREAPGRLPERLFLQNYRTDPCFPQLFSKVRDSQTAFIEKSMAELPIHHGVYVDVFPLDDYPADRREQRRLERRKSLQLWKLSAAYCSPKTGRAALAALGNRVFQFDQRISAHVARLERALTRYKGPRSDILCNHGNWQGKREYAPRGQYGDGAWATFEGLPVRVPAQYDEYLTQKYGDWRADLPEEQKTGHHDCVVCDVRRPYTDYIERLPNGKIRVKRPRVRGE